MSVVASRTRAGDMGRSVEIISRDDIARSGARTVADVLRSRLSVDVDSRSPVQSDVSLRASSPEQVVVLVDGVRVSDAQSAHYAMDLAVPLRSIARIEILRGGGSALYGPDAVGGVINIVTTQRTLSPELQVQGGGFGTAGGGAGATQGNDTRAMTVHADYEKSDGHRPGTDYRRGQARVALSRQGASGVLRTSLGAAVRDFGAADFYGPYNSTERTGTTTWDARWLTSRNDWTFSTGAATRRHTDDYILIRDRPAIYQNVHKTWQTSGDVLARGSAGPLALAVGADAAHDQLASTRLGGHREWRSGLYAEGTIGDRSATLNVGLRGDRSSGYGAFFSPSVSTAWEVVPAVRLRASAARGFRAPTWTERYYADPSSIGNKDLRAERFWSGDAGVRWTPGSVVVDVAGYTREADALIDWVKPTGAPSATPWRATNVGTATYRGFEAQVQLPRFHRVDYSLYANGVTLDASQGAALTGKYALRPLTRQMGMRIAHRLADAVDVHVDLGEARRAGESGYLTGNARFQWQHNRARVAFDVHNLTNAGWRDASGKPSAPRLLLVSAGWAAQ